MFKLQEFISKDRIFFNVKGNSKRAVIKETVRRICEIENITNDCDTLLKLILKREKLEATAIGKGFAIPHCNFKGFNGIKIYVSFPEIPVNFRAKYNDLVRVMFVIISDNNSNEMYLKALSYLMYFIKNTHSIEDLISIDSPQKFLAIVKKSDNDLNYISYKSLHLLTSLLILEDEINTYSHEITIEKGKRQGKNELDNDLHYQKLCKSKEKLVLDIDYRLMSIYNQLKAKYGGLITSKIKDKSCEYCNVQLPVHMIREASRKNQIIQCTMCSKILII